MPPNAAEKRAGWRTGRAVFAGLTVVLIAGGLGCRPPAALAARLTISPDDIIGGHHDPFGHAVVSLTGACRDETAHGAGDGLIRPEMNRVAIPRCAPILREPETDQ